jgi:hypothetical protein
MSQYIQYIKIKRHYVQNIFVLEKDEHDPVDYDRIYVKGSSPYCIFGTEKCVSPVLAVRLDAR